MDVAAGPMVDSLAAGPSPGADACVEHTPARRWREVEQTTDVKPGERSGAASVMYQDSLYVFGGYGGSGRLDDIFQYDFHKRCWSKVEAKGQIPAGRENNGAVVHGGKMYLFGGYSGFTWLNDLFDFDFRRQSWASTHVQGFIPSGRSCPSWA